ncbi:MAG: nitroreductase [Lachnospiraceae bacterium]|jgi:nitroreductase/NAD-dependent dihydropyrimidine dehydrogenase PreA subunit|nr:nitroreductase [Lachnospiraceae bacterium]
MVKIDQERCIGCGLCADDCLALNIELKEEKANIKNECLLCGHCVAICPEHAVSIPEYDMDDVEEYDADSFKLNPENVLHAIKFRRSIRSYKPQKISQEYLNLLVQAGRYTATAKNNQNCCFVVVQDELEELKQRIWGFIDALEERAGGNVPHELMPYIAFNHRRKIDAFDDFLFRNAPAVLFITSDWPLDAGLAAQNIETMAVSLGMGVLYNGYVVRIAEKDKELKEWLGIKDETIKACMLLGYSAKDYPRTAPRRKPRVVWK